MTAPDVQTPGGNPANAETKTSDALDFIASNPACQEKAFQNLRARCALAGVSLIESNDDHGRPVFIVSRWALTKQLDSLAAVDAWLARVEIRP